MCNIDSITKSIAHLPADAQIAALEHALTLCKELDLPEVDGEFGGPLVIRLKESLVYYKLQRFVAEKYAEAPKAPEKPKTRAKKLPNTVFSL